ncbi:hypothetical protein KFK09_019321 [Dendrobium nobile]|uniref:Uncharacterized protein n=1 Tax=Dendrobium nobile TaxID=94219 RepID=A0A8T3AX86_DENNO|nr:hypothetical protein KFK09_019321 [Dendrobium nobile]
MGKRTEYWRSLPNLNQHLDNNVFMNNGRPSEEPVNGCCVPMREKIKISLSTWLPEECSRKIRLFWGGFQPRAYLPFDERGGGLAKLKASGGGLAELRASSDNPTELRASSGGLAELRVSGGDLVEVRASSGGSAELRAGPQVVVQ